LLAVNNVVEDIVHRDLAELRTAAPSRARALIAEIQATLPVVAKELQAKSGQFANAKAPPPSTPAPRSLASAAIVGTARPYGAVKAPALMLAAYPVKCAPNCDTPYAKALFPAVQQQVAFVAALNPGDKVVKLPYADHFVWRSNPDEVMREMNAFMDGLH
jgi:non-heme chloroperoxidase